MKRSSNHDEKAGDKLILFAGPSLTNRSRELAEVANVELRGPAKRRQVQHIVEQGYRGHIAIADGVFNQSAAVGHAELRLAIRSGCKVYGLSSMGAIRAWEMRNLGMIGYGKAYQYFRTMEDFQDDELALLHGPAPDYRPFSEPMVHFRYCISELVVGNRIDTATATALVDFMKQRYFGERTLGLFRTAMVQNGIDFGQSIIENFDKYRIKARDLEQFLAVRFWEKNTAL